MTGITRETIFSQTLIDVVYYTQKVQADILKSTTTDHYTVQSELDKNVKETGLKMQEYYRVWPTLEANTVLEKLVLKLKHILQSLLDKICLSDCDSAFENFQQTLIYEKTLCVREIMNAIQTKYMN